MLSTTVLAAIGAGGGGALLLLLFLLLWVVRWRRQKVAARNRQSSVLERVTAAGDSPALLPVNASTISQRIAADLQPKPSRVIDPTMIDAKHRSATRLLGQPPAGLAEEEHKHRRNPLYETVSKGKAQALEGNLGQVLGDKNAEQADAKSQTHSYDEAVGGGNYTQPTDPADPMAAVRDVGAVAKSRRLSSNASAAKLVDSNPYDQAQQVGAEGPYYSQVKEMAEGGHYYNNIAGENYAEGLGQGDEPVLPHEEDSLVFEALAKQIHPVVEPSAVSFRGLLNAGVFGAVAKGRMQTESGDEMVIITVLPTEAPREGSAALKMAVLLQSLDHKRILKVAGIAIAPERVLLMTEFTLDGTLQGRLVKEGATLTQQERVVFARDVADALAYVASSGIAHGDVRAATVVLVNGMCKLSDFGFSRYISQRESLMALRWTAPELSLFDRPSITGDIFSFAVLLMEIYSNGAIPYTSQGWSDEQVHQHVKKGYRLPQPPLMDDDIFELTSQCWAENVARRPTFDNIADRLTRLGNLEPLSSAATPQDGRARIPDLSRLSLSTMVSKHGSSTSAESVVSGDEWGHIARTGKKLEAHDEEGSQSGGEASAHTSARPSFSAGVGSTGPPAVRARSSIDGQQQPLPSVAEAISAEATYAYMDHVVNEMMQQVLTPSPTGGSKSEGVYDSEDVIRELKTDNAARKTSRGVLPPIPHAVVNAPPYMRMDSGLNAEATYASANSVPAAAGPGMPTQTSSRTLINLGQAMQAVGVVRQPSVPVLKGYEDMEDAHLPKTAEADMTIDFSPPPPPLPRPPSTMTSAATTTTAAAKPPSSTPPSSKPPLSKPPSSKNTAAKQNSRPHFAADEVPAPVPPPRPSQQGFSVGGLAERRRISAPVIQTDGVADGEGEYYETVSVPTPITKCATSTDKAGDGGGGGGGGSDGLVQMPKKLQTQSESQYEPTSAAVVAALAAASSAASLAASKAEDDNEYHQPTDIGSLSATIRPRTGSVVPALVSSDANAVLMMPAALKSQGSGAASTASSNNLSGPAPIFVPGRYERVEDFKKQASAQPLPPTPPKRESLGERLQQQGKNNKTKKPSVLAEADEEDEGDRPSKGSSSNYVTPRALLEPEWLHGPISREEAEQMVRDTSKGGGVPGAYLFRRKDEADAFAITVMIDWERVEHFLLQYDGKMGWYLNGDVKSSCGDPHHNLMLVLANLCDSSSPWALPLNVPVSCLKR